MKCLFLLKFVPPLNVLFNLNPFYLTNQALAQANVEGKSIIAPISLVMSIHMVTTWGNGFYQVTWLRPDLAAGH